MASYSGVYLLSINSVSISGTNPILQLKPASSFNCEIIRAWCVQSGSTTSTQQRIQLSRFSAAATVTSFTPLVLNGAQAAKAVGSTSGTGHTGSSSGTETDILYPDVFNILNGWLYVPVPEERIVIKSGDILGMRFPTPPGTALTVTAGIIFAEYGS